MWFSSSLANTPWTKAIKLTSFSPSSAMDIAKRSENGYWAISIGLLLSCSTLAFLFVTACSDPGIIPRKIAPVDDRASIRQKPPRRQDFVINGKLVTLKYCCKGENMLELCCLSDWCFLTATCKIYRPPRCSHCGVCDNCVELLYDLLQSIFTDIH
jgi:hypothetical protein